MKKALFLLLPVLVLAMAAPASANHFREFYAGADCDGWWANGSIYLVSGDDVDLYYEVTLLEGSTEIAAFDGMVNVTDADEAFSFMEAWGMELCGEYTAEGRFWFTSALGSDERTFSVGFVCECDTTPDYCNYTPGYWKNHEEAWPVDELTLGGVTLSMAAALDLFDAPTKGDITIILAQHLMAAKLNVANGSDPSIQPAIDAADAYLMMYPVGSRPNGTAKDEGEMYKDELCDYNELGCPGDDMPDFIGTAAEALGAGTEDSSWGAIKKQLD
ncbi:MAG: hypothetical protein JW876_10260 [Candidatus Krumholzibacteriota bacterium]|nr:hypothetical protein [Candidatus Krumholzibacteriota bacterium]